MARVKVAVIDVGSNSVRLLVAAVGRKAGIKQLERGRTYLRLGDDAYRLGRIGDEKLEAARRVARSYARTARKRGAVHLQTIVTAPGRQASNGEDLLRTLADATDAPVVLLSAEEEGRLAWEGAVSSLDDPARCVAVVDLGGGSCEIAVGTPSRGAAWVESREAGSLRVARSLVGKKATRAPIEAARNEVRRLLDGFDPPRPELALAVGGTARAIGRLLGRRYGADHLESLVVRLAGEGVTRVTEGTGITPERAETLLGGTLVLTEIARLLDVELEVGRGGLREGAALALDRAQAAGA